MRNTEINFPELQSGSANLSYIMDFSLYIKTPHKTEVLYGVRCYINMAE